MIEARGLYCAITIKKRTTCCRPLPEVMKSYRVYELFLSSSVPNRYRGVVVAVAVIHRQGHPSGSVSAIPADGHAVLEYG